MKNRSLRGIIKSCIFYVVLILIICFTLFPIVWLASMGFKTSAEYWALPPRIIPAMPTLQNFKEVLVGFNITTATGASYLSPSPYLLALKNSVVASSVSTLFSVVLASFAGYALARFRFKGNESIGYWILSLRVIPPVVVALPYFELMSWVHLIDTVWALIIVYTLANLPFAVWLLRSFFQDVSPSFEEAAMTDGCSRMQAFVRVVWPIAMPGIIATAIFCLVSAWNEFLFALVLTDINAVTLPVVLVRYVTSTAYLWGPIGAGAIISVLPVIVFAMLIHRHLVRVMTLGAIKGE